MANTAIWRRQSTLRCWRKVMLTCLLPLLIIFGASVTAAVAAEPGNETVSVMLKLASGLTPAEQAAVISRHGGGQTSSIAALRLHVVEFPADNLSLKMEELQADPQIERVELNKTRKAEAVPADPDFSIQWALSKIGWESVFGAVTPVDTATIALLDTGIDSTHPDLTGKVMAGVSLFDNSNGLVDPNGHGTWMAGIAAAVTDNGQGIAGVAPAGVQLLPVTVLGANGIGQDSDIIAGILWAVDNGADVILMGFSNPDFSQNLQDAIDYAWEQGVVLVAATGNDGVSTPTFPAGARGVIGVAATDQNDGLYFGSNYGQSVFLAAPGVDIFTIDLGQSYRSISGTSASSAIVAGVAAYMKAVNPDLSNGVIVGRLARSADPAGIQEETGNGRINMANALADTSLDFIQPAGAEPVGAGGPYVGPYTAAARIVTITINGSGTVSIDPKAGTANPRSGTTTFTSSINQNNGTGTLTATAGAGSTFAGWSDPSSGITCDPPSSTTCSYSMENKPQSVTATFTALLTPTVAVTNLSQTYTGSPIAAVVACSSGGTVSDIKYDRLLTTPTDAGTYTVTADCTAAGNYTSLDDAAAGNYMIGKAAATITLGNLGPHTYDGTLKAATAVTEPAGLAGLTVSGSGTDAGDYPASASLDNPNYTAEPVSGTLEIGKAAATITLGNLGPHTYDGKLKAATAVTEPADLAGLTVSGSGTDAGDYPASASLDNLNYTAAPVSGNLVIGKVAQSISFAPLADRNEGDDPFAVTAIASSGLSVSFTAEGSCTVEDNRVTLTGAGSCTITASQPGNANYSPAPQVARAFDIAVAEEPDVPAGSNVAVSPGNGVEIRFAEVTGSGELTVQSTGMAPPANHRFVPGAAFEISTSANFSSATVCLSYNPAALFDPANEPNLMLHHHNGAGWHDITTLVDTAGKKVCGETTSFSPIAVVEPLASSFTITATVSGSGSTDPAAGVNTVAAGDSQSYTFTPDAGWLVQNVMVNGLSQGPLDAYTFSSVQANQTLKVFFARKLYTVTASASDGGSISPADAREYVDGTSPAYIITPAAGYHIEDVLVGGVSVGAVTSYTFPGIEADSTIHAVFAANPGWTISASVTGSGIVTPAGSTVVLGGTQQSYSFAPDAGWRVGSVVIDGADKGVQTSWTFSNVSADHTVEVNFVEDSFTITASAGSNGSIDPAGVSTVARGGSQSYTFTPAAGYQVQNVLLNGVSQGAPGSYTITNVQANQTISVSFVGLTHTVTASATAGGTISPLGSREYSEGTSPTYIITPAAGYHVQDVLVDGVSVGALTSHTFTAISADTTIHAVFAANPSWTISASATGSGTVTPAGDTVVAGGTQQKYTFTPDAGYKVGSVVIDGVNKGAQSSWTFSNVTADHTVEVTFVPDVFTITASAGAGGSISPAGTVSVTRGGSQTFTFTPDPGYKVDRVNINGINKGNFDSYTFSNVTMNQTIRVIFSKLP